MEKTKETPIIKFENFNFKYDSQAEKNLKDINFEVYEGETILILGPSGSGKSTIARCINGQIPHTYHGITEGELIVKGKEVQSSSIFDLSHDVGTVLQDTDGQFVGLTVAEDIAFVLENDCVPQVEMQDLVVKWSESLDIDQHLSMTPSKLSGGQKQRVSISGILVNDIPILLLDEPLANLDPASGEQTMRLLKQLKKDRQYTTIIVEHRLEEALISEVDRILVVNDGKIIANTTPTELLKSNILSDVGIREPLYLTALKYSGVNLDSFEKLGTFKEIELDQSELQQVEEWAKQVPLSEKVSQSVDVIQLEEVSYSYDLSFPTKTLDNISLTINQGDMISIVGANGAGKSTLAKLICGFVRPKEGRILIDDTDISSLSITEIADHVGFVMQNPNNMISKTMVFDEVASGLLFRNINPDEVKEKVEKALKICGLYPYRNWPISALSYGQKRRVTIASILVLNPKVIILDEPTAGQDYAHYTEMMRFIEKINQEKNITIIMITHDMHLMQEYTNRTFVFNKGRLLADTKPSKVFSDDSLIKAAHLAETSLYQLGESLPNMSSLTFIEAFMHYEEGIR
ncbi:ABC transporter ATP-binding protein [Aerococcaceae bacterium WGS1372]